MINIPVICTVCDVNVGAEHENHCLNKQFVQSNSKWCKLEHASNNDRGTSSVRDGHLSADGGLNCICSPHWASDITTIIQSGHFNAYSTLLIIPTRKVLLSKHKIYQLFSSKCNWMSNIIILSKIWPCSLNFHLAHCEIFCKQCLSFYRVTDLRLWLLLGTQKVNDRGHNVCIHPSLLASQLSAYNGHACSITYLCTELETISIGKRAISCPLQSFFH